MDTRNHSAIKNVANELQDVQKIMGRVFVGAKPFLKSFLPFSGESGRSFTTRNLFGCYTKQIIKFTQLFTTVPG